MTLSDNKQLIFWEEKMSNPFEFMQSMMNQDNYMKNFKGFESMNFGAAPEVMKKNMEVLTSANQMASESLQTIMKRGSDSFQKNATEMFNSMKDAVSAGDFEQINHAGQKYLKSSLENSINNTKEILDMAAKSSMEILDLVGKNMSENLNKSFQPKQKKQ